jgi:hypothetical protein
MLTVPKPFDVGVGLLLGHVPGCNGPGHVHLGVTGLDGADRSLEFFGALGGPQIGRFVLGDPSGGDHLVELPADAILVHLI